jgi:undecaprenyl-diphosphatase
MNFIAAIKAVFLGVIEGLTEFIPVSSTAHLLLSSKLVDFSYIKDDVFEIVIQLGAILAIIILYRKKIFDVIVNLFFEKSSQNFVLNILIAFLPAAVFGLLFHKLIKLMFFNPISIALALLIGGILILVVEKLAIKPKCCDVNNLSFKQSIGIGLFQIISMIPGVSRSGATIIGGLLLKLDRKTATEFSFFLSIPTIFAASIFDFYKNYSSFDNDKIYIIIIGFISAFLSSLVVIKWFINFVSNHSFKVFAYYRIILGLFLLLTLF